MISFKKILFATLFITSGTAARAQKTATMLLANPTAVQRDDELIVISRKQLEKKTGFIPVTKYVVVLDNNKRPLVIQHDDKNGDKVWDEIVLLQSFKSFEKKIFTVSFSNSPSAIKAQVRSHVRHSRKNSDNSFGPLLDKDSTPAGQPATDFSRQALPPFLTEGPAWENDKVGFRIYLDVRNTKDIWGKTTSKMVMDDVGVDPAKNYHQLSDWGMDILKVGKSLGAGSLALQVRQANGKDTLIRLGGINMGKVIYEKIADGPLRATFRLHYPEWKVLDQIPPVSVIEEISIWGGQYFYESKVDVIGAPRNSQLIAGFANFESKLSHTLDTAGRIILYSYDTQSENKDQLGMAILVNKSSFKTAGKTPDQNTDVQSSYTMAASLQPKLPAVFRFYAGWEKSDQQFRSLEGFKKFLIRQAASVKDPIVVSIHSLK